MCVVINSAIIKDKLSDHDVFGVMVEYSPQHSKGTYQIFLLDTLQIVNTRDIKWLNQYYGKGLDTDDGFDNAPVLDGNNKDDTFKDESNSPGFFFSGTPKDKQEIYGDSDGFNDGTNDDNSMPSLQLVHSLDYNSDSAISSLDDFKLMILMVLIKMTERGWNHIPTRNFIVSPLKWLNIQRDQ